MFSLFICSVTYLLSSKKKSFTCWFSVLTTVHDIPADCKIDIFCLAPPMFTQDTLNTNSSGDRNKMPKTSFGGVVTLILTPPWWDWSQMLEMCCSLWLKKCVSKFNTLLQCFATRDGHFPSSPGYQLIKKAKVSHWVVINIKGHKKWVRVRFRVNLKKKKTVAGFCCNFGKQSLSFWKKFNCLKQLFLEAFSRTSSIWPIRRGKLPHFFVPKGLTRADSHY